MTRSTGSGAPTPKMKRLYHQLTVHLIAEEPKDLWVFDPVELPQPSPKVGLIHVAVWTADKHCNVTGFQTMGMSERRMKDADYFAELHLAIRGRLKKKERQALAGFLANVAQYPFDHDRTLDWWHVLSNPGRIPSFPGCRHLLLHPRLGEKGFDEIDDPEGKVKVFYVVPITPLERHLVVDHPRSAFLDYVEERRIDLLADRTDPEWECGSGAGPPAGK
jgi:hypothetical protein